MHPEQQEIPAHLYTNGGEDDDPINLDAYLSQNGMITLSLNDDTWLQMSPLAAKRLIELLCGAVGESVIEILDPGRCLHCGAISMY